MNCDANSLVSAAYCLTRLQENQLWAAMLYLACQWANVEEPACPYHPLVCDWELRVLANGGAQPTAPTLQALSDFCDALDDDGLTAEFILLAPLVPDSFIAALTPLITTGDDPLTNLGGGFEATDLSFDGLEGNESDRVLDTGINVLTGTADFDVGLTLINTTNSQTVNSNDIGCGFIPDLDILQLYVDSYNVPAGNAVYDCYYGGGRGQGCRCKCWLDWLYLWKRHSTK